MSWNHGIATATGIPIAVAIAPIRAICSRGRLRTVASPGCDQCAPGNSVLYAAGRRAGGAFVTGTGLGTLATRLHRSNGRWHVPNSTWAGSLAGRLIPPGPDDPLVARWMGIDDQGDGIHGTNEPSSIGSAASHGCIRMLVPDVIQLYSLTPLGTPVYVL